MKARTLRLVPLLALGCSSAGTAEPRDAGHDTRRHDATQDAALRDGSGDSPKGPKPVPDGASDVALPTTVLVRLANWSPDAPGIDLCLAPHGSSIFRGPVLSGALGTGVFGTLTIVDENGTVDAGLHVDAHLDAQPDAHLDAHLDAEADAPPDAHDAIADTSNDGPSDAGAPSGVTFPRVSPYVAVSPGEYDVRVLTAGAKDCTAPLFADRTDLSAFVAGTVATLAAVGDLNAVGTDPAIGLVVYADDVRVPSGQVGVRFVNGVPSVTVVSFVKSGVVFQPIVVAIPFGGLGVDVDGGPLDSNDYLSLPPVSNTNWFVINGNSTKTVLAGVYNVAVPPGNLATAVAIGGESGPTEAAIGVLVCLDRPPIVLGETATCSLLEGPGITSPVCPACK